MSGETFDSGASEGSLDLEGEEEERDEEENDEVEEEESMDIGEGSTMDLEEDE